MQVNREAEMADVLQSCLPALDDMEASFVQDCWLREPQVALKTFAEQWHLSPKDLAELRSRVLVRLQELLAARGITSVADMV